MGMTVCILIRPFWDNFFKFKLKKNKSKMLMNYIQIN